MIFNSLEFLFFLLIVYTAYRILPFRAQNTLLLIASYVFYGWWNERLLFLILLTTTVDFCCSLMIDKGQLTRTERLIPSLWITLAAFLFVTVNWDAVHLTKGVVEWSQLLPISWLGWLVFAGTLLFVTVANWLYPKSATLAPQQRKKVFLIASIAINLGILCVFKYFNFFISSAEAALSAAGLQTDFWSLNILLPVGISFYTFQTMSYTIDVYRGDLKSTHRFFDFALFVSFFPQLVAGPIVRASELLPQLLQPRSLTFDQTIRGLYLILFGLFKKVAIADGLAGSVNAVYGANSASWIDIVAATLLFTFQIYCDFSGYSDIARGVAKLFGIELMVNFNLPYFSKTPSEFWRRWHISLSTWLRDYLYISLGGNRKGNARTYQNLMTTMALGGLWHGAAWNYVFWGIYQGTLLCVYRMLGLEAGKKSAATNPPLLRSLAMMAIFFGLTGYGWLLFRASSFGQIAEFTRILLTDIGNFSLSMPKPTLPALLGLPLLMLYELLEYRAATAHFYYRYSALIRGAFYAALTMLIVMGTSNAPAQFIYFQF
ncbi:MAG: MBOAT family protein [Cyanobacteria bacterium RM1_2_2]|nr:MBOAT family protein [Cyanobacteria bacterium RM1_2_2]